MSTSEGSNSAAQPAAAATDQEDSPDVLASMAKQVALAYAEDADRSDDTRALVEEVFRTLLGRAAVEIREVLSDALKSCSTLPKDIALTLATDVATVSCRFIEDTQALGDAEFMQVIAKTSDPAVYRSVAARDLVSSTVANALIATGDAKAIASLVNNEGAALTQEAFTTILQHHAGNRQLTTAIASRDDLPPQIIDLIIDKVAAPLRHCLRQRATDERTLERLNVVLLQSLNQARLGLLGDMSRAETKEAANYFSDDHDLSPFAALCMGNFRLFRVVLARRANVPVRKVNLLLDDLSHAGPIKDLCEQAGIPSSFYEAVEITLMAIRAIANMEGRPLADIDKMPLVVLIDTMVFLARDRNIEYLDFMLSMMRQHQRESRGQASDN